MLFSHKDFRGLDSRITDPTELDIAENKLNYLAQIEFFAAELKTLTTRKPSRNTSESAT